MWQLPFMGQSNDPVNGINEVAVLCQGEGCDCLLNISINRDPKTPSLSSEIKNKYHNRTIAMK